MTLGAEMAAVQWPLTRYAIAAGWQPVTRLEAEALRGGESGLVFADTLATQLELLNSGRISRAQADDLVHKFTRVPATIKGNFDAWEHLRGLRTVFLPEEKQERNVRFLDVDDPDTNLFQVTEEWSYRPRPDAESIRFDVVFLINGIPVLLVETKAAHKKEGMAEALDQIVRYHNQGPEQLAISQLFGITHIHRFLYGVTWNPAPKNTYDWREETAGNFEELVTAFVDRHRVIKVLYDFIVFATIEGEFTKFVLRPHQMRASDKVLARAKDPAKRRGLIWHTQGSGKTYTMITAARLLVADPAMSNPTVLVLVDRTELEGQMSENLEALGFTDVRVAESKEELEQILRSDWRGIVLSMIHKFDKMPADLCARENVVVLIDEAHRTTAGSLGTYLMAAVPNATFVGFTGTPIDKTAHGKGTFKVFGPDDVSGFLDKYSIADSVPDGTTLPLKYGHAPNALQVDRAVLEEEFLKAADAEGMSDVETLNKVLERAVTLRAMMKNPDRIDAIARHIAEHYKENVEKSGFKAFAVAVDREACVLYKKALDKYLPPEYSDVIISPAHNDGPDLRRYHYDEEKEKRIRLAFRNNKKWDDDAKGCPRILIVTDKLLTGFDAPVLYCMYLDKPMRDHILLQAIARVNRPYEDEDGRLKSAGLIIDFVGIFAKLEDALAFDSEDRSGIVEGLDVLQKRFAELMARGRAEYLPLGRGLVADKEVEAIVEYFRDEDRRIELQEFVSELENLFEILSPDAFLRDYLDDYDKIMRIAAVMREAFYPGLDISRSFQRKTAELVRQYASLASIGLPTSTQDLTPETLGRLVDDTSTSDTSKVVNLVKLIHDIVAKEKTVKPFLISIGQRAEDVAELFRNRQMTTEEALVKFREFTQEIVDGEKAQAETGLEHQAFAVLWYLRGKGVDESKASELALAASEAFQEFPEWRRASQQESDLRLRLYGAILKTGLDADPTMVVDEILASLRTMRQ